MTLSLTCAGFNYVADVEGSYARADSLGAMVSGTSSNSVALTVDYGIDASKSRVYADSSTESVTGITETLENLTRTIRQAVEAKLTVTVRPLIDFSPNASREMLTSSDGTEYRNGDWRAYYMPTDTKAFFDSYDEMVVAQARAAQEGGAQIFDIGTELDGLTGRDYLEDWTRIIRDVRAVFSGQLVYSAIWDDGLSPWQYGPGRLERGTGDIATQVSFWEQVDLVGIDQYAGLSESGDPKLSELVDGWTKTPTVRTTLEATGGVSLIEYYQGIAASIGKPLVFTELGYRSASDSAADPAGSSGTTYDPALQARLFQAFFDAWDAQKNPALAGVFIWNWEPDPSTVNAGKEPNWTPQGNDAALTIIQSGFAAATACFAAGTRIATAAGEVAVEALRVGDLVVTAAGACRPVAWVGRQRIDLVAHPRAGRVQPVRVAADAFGPGQPRRPLFLSPDHAVWWGGALIPVGRLVNGGSVVQGRRSWVEYWHVELDGHDVLIAEGLACESYRDTGNRAGFAEGRPGVHSGVVACGPMVEDGPVLERARGVLAARAGGASTQMDVALAAEGVVRVVVGAGIETVRLVGPSAVRAGDVRRLGALVTEVRLGGVGVRLDDGRLGLGFHDLEVHGAQPVRWTDGAASIRVGAAVRERVLEVSVGALGFVERGLCAA